MDTMHEAVARAIRTAAFRHENRDDPLAIADAAIGVMRERIAALQTPDPNLTGEGYADWVGYERALTDMLALFD